jgi:putative ABC transport system substrate-binding protein
LTAAAFPNIAQVARRARMPVFAFQSSQSDSAVLTLARDYYDSGREAGKMVGRVMRGESPGSIPLLPLANIKTIVNTRAARETGLTVPPDILASANKVIE